MKLWLFYFGLGLSAYIFLGYPLLVGLLAALRPRRTEKGDFYPMVSVLLPVYNEEKSIEKRVANLNSLKYPKEKVELLIGSDGSTDGTNEILRSHTPPHLTSPARGEGLMIRVFIFPERRGKPSVLNDLAKEAAGEILVFADCRQRWNGDALKNLMRNFADGQVGVVSGIVKEGGGGFYRNYENFIRTAEGLFSSVPGATGAIYGMRKDLFKPLPAETILDDFILPMEAVRRGFRSVLESEAVAYDHAFTLAQEKIRKTRTLAGNFQVFFLCPWLLNPTVNPIWFQTFSHKFLRLFAPVFLLLLFLISPLLWNKGVFFRIFFLLEVLFLLLAFIGRRLGKKYKILGVFAAFLELNRATVLGFSHFITGRQKVTWKKTEG